MLTRSASVIGAAVLILTCVGCTFEHPPLRAPEPNGCARVVADDGCAPPDPRIVELAVRVSAIDGREGWYGREALATVAADRDELVERVVYRAAALERCEPDPTRREDRKGEQVRLVAALLAGRDPFAWSEGILVFDDVFAPRVMPFASRVCDGRGLEGAASCLAFGPPVAIVDISTFLLGTWIWAGEPEREPVLLDSLAPSADVQLLVEQRLPAARERLGLRCPVDG